MSLDCVIRAFSVAKMRHTSGLRRHRQMCENKNIHKKGRQVWDWWLMPVMLTTQEAEMRRIVV
jgi:hypothetical protein